MLKTWGSIESKTWPGEGGVGVGDGSRVEHDNSKRDTSRIDDNKVDGGEVRDDEFGKKVEKLSKFKNLSKSKKW